MSILDEWAKSEQAKAMQFQPKPASKKTLEERAAEDVARTWHEQVQGAVGNGGALPAPPGVGHVKARVAEIQAEARAEKFARAKAEAEAKEELRVAQVLQEGAEALHHLQVLSQGKKKNPATQMARKLLADRETKAKEAEEKRLRDEIARVEAKLAKVKPSGEGNGEQK